MAKLIKSVPLTMLDVSPMAELAVYLYDRTKDDYKGTLIGYIWKDNRHLYKEKPLIRYRCVTDERTKIRGNVTSEIASVTQLIDFVSRNVHSLLGVKK